MIRKKPYLYLCLFFIALFSAFTSNLSFGQHSTSKDLGIAWQIPNLPSKISSDLSQYKELGFNLIEVEHPVNSAILDSLSHYGFDVWLRFNKKFITTSYLEKNSSLLLEEYQSLIENYTKYEFIKAFGLYSNSQSLNDQFNLKFDQIESELKRSINISQSLYEISSVQANGLDFSLTKVTNDSIPNGMDYYYLSKTYQRNDFYTLNSIMRRSPTRVFIDSGWLHSALKDYPILETTISEFYETGNFILPLPKKEPSAPFFNWPILIFAGIWISVGLHIILSGTYKPLITRYFTGHKFFVDDIMRYRERSTISGVFLFFQHALFTGLVVYIISSLLISEIGLEALFDITPQLGILGENYFSLFVIGAVFSCIIQLISLAWLYFPSTSMTHFSQTLTLYTWIFHIDFLIVSIMLILLLTGGSGFIILSLATLFILTGVIGFFLTALDSSKYLLQKKAKYMIYTFALRSLVNIGIVILLLSYKPLLDFIELVISI